MINRVVLVGRLTKDPSELRRSTSGNAVTSFTLAVDRRFVKQDDQSQQQADFISCVVWNKTAEFVSQYAKKGSLVGVEGRLQSRSYDSKEGYKVYVTEVVCDNVQLLEPKSVNSQRTNESLSQGTPHNGGYETQPEPQYDDHDDVGIDVPDDDLPF